MLAFICKIVNRITQISFSTRVSSLVLQLMRLWWPKDSVTLKVTKHMFGHKFRQN